MQYVYIYIYVLVTMPMATSLVSQLTTPKWSKENNVKIQSARFLGQPEEKSTMGEKGYKYIAKVARQEANPICSSERLIRGI